MSGPRVGVAMAAYNGARYIRPQLESILAQERMPDQVVIVDDASTDTTPDILADIAAGQSGRVRVMTNRENRGAPYTFAKAIAHCETRYVALADQDDEWLPDKLAVMASAAARHPDAGMWFHDLAIMNPQGAPRAESFWAVAPAEAPLPVTGRAARERIAGYSNPVPGCTMLIDTARHTALLPFASALAGHDWWISAVCFFLGAPHAVDRPLGRYRLHPYQLAGIGTCLERHPDEKLRLPLHAKIWREARRLVHRARDSRERASKRRLEQRAKDTALLSLLDRALGGDGPAGREAEYRALRREIAGRLEETS